MLKNWIVNSNGFKHLPYPLRQLKEDSRRDETVLHFYLNGNVLDKDLYEDYDNKFYVEDNNDYVNLKVNINRIFYDKACLTPLIKLKRNIPISGFFSSDVSLVKRYWLC